MDKLKVWEETIRGFGIEEAQRAPQFHDHALKGPWKGCHSIYLDRTTWRLIYRIMNTNDGEPEIVIQFVEVVEVNPHEY